MSSPSPSPSPFPLSLSLSVCLSSSSPPSLSSSLSLSHCLSLSFSLSPSVVDDEGSTRGTTRRDISCQRLLQQRSRSHPPVNYMYNNPYTFVLYPYRQLKRNPASVPMWLLLSRLEERNGGSCDCHVILTFTSVKFLQIISQRPVRF